MDWRTLGLGEGRGCLTEASPIDARVESARVEVEGGEAALLAQLNNPALSICFDPMAGLRGGGGGWGTCVPSYSFPDLEVSSSDGDMRIRVGDEGGKRFGVDADARDNEYASASPFSRPLPSP
jgi:hypothetical protein